MHPEDSSLAVTIEQIADYGLLARADVQTLVDALPAEERPQDVLQLTKLLVDQQKLREVGQCST